MFNFTTTTILNSDKDVSGKAMFSSKAAEGNIGAILRVKRDFTFQMPGIKKVFKKVGSEPTKCKITIDCDALIKALPTDVVYPVSGRLALYVRLEGSEESGFANDFYQKGQPFSLGYIITSAETTGSELATAIKKTADRFNIATVGRRIFNVTVEDSKVVFEGTDEYFRFAAVAILMDLGYKEQELAHLFDGEQDNDQTVITVDSRGVNGFGTFRHLAKDLRLPTATNTSWTNVYWTDKPVPGELYDQYIIHYDFPSMTNPSLAAVGHKTKSKTTHCFWVKQGTLSDSFSTCIEEVVGAAPVKDDPTAIFEEVE